MQLYQTERYISMESYPILISPTISIKCYMLTWHTLPNPSSHPCDSVVSCQDPGCSVFSLARVPVAKNDNNSPCQATNVASRYIDFVYCYANLN